MVSSLQIAEPSIVKWLASTAIEEGKKAGRDMSNYKVMSAAPAYFGTREECIAATRWFPAMVGNHVADIVEKYGTERDDIPSSSDRLYQGSQGV